MTSGRCLAAIRENAECFGPVQNLCCGYNNLRTVPVGHPRNSECNSRCGSIPAQSLCFGRFLADIQVEPSVSFSRYARARNFAV